MSKWLLASLIVLTLVLGGCVDQGEQSAPLKICPDGTQVTDLALCPVQEGSTAGAGSDESLYQELAECETLDEEVLITKCKESGQNAVICENLYRDGLISECIKSVIKASDDSRICNYFTEVSGREFCLYNFVTTHPNTEICDQMLPLSEDLDIYQSFKDACYREVAIAKETEQICENIDNWEIKNECYWKVAKAKKDSSICNLINNERSKELCLGEIQ